MKVQLVPSPLNPALKAGPLSRVIKATVAWLHILILPCQHHEAMKADKEVHNGSGSTSARQEQLDGQGDTRGERERAGEMEET